MEETFRIREVALNTNKTNIWFYPEILSTKTIKEKTSKIFFWKKKEITKETWKSLFTINNGNNLEDFKNIRSLYYYEEEELLGVMTDKYKVVGFRFLPDAIEWLQKYKNFKKEEQNKSSESFFKYVASIQNKVNEDYVTIHKLDDVLTYEERINWFFENYYETGMELKIMLDSWKEYDLDNMQWHHEIIKVPKLKSELVNYKKTKAVSFQGAVDSIKQAPEEEK